MFGPLGTAHVFSARVRAHRNTRLSQREELIDDLCKSVDLIGGVLKGREHGFVAHRAMVSPLQVGNGDRLVEWKSRGQWRRMWLWMMKALRQWRVGPA